MDRTNTVLVTGATSGFGRAIAEIFAENQWNVIITGRRKDRLSMIAEKLKREHNVRVLQLQFDIRNKNEVKEAVESIPGGFHEIDILVNNAGLASGFDDFHEADIEDWEVMIDTNIKGLLYMSRLISPGMVQRGSGHIINIGSTAAKVVYPKGNVYCATKFAVDAISNSMRIDLLQHGIKVTALHPGAAETEFSVVRFHGDNDRAARVYDGFEPMNARDIAEVCFFAATRPPNLVLNEIIMTPLAQANSSYIHRNE
jgi:NADP-dependent 3-hydroxy acid dehydrogenase YdfG